jgi:hypothetical protein
MTVVTVDNDPAPSAMAVYCLPEEYERLEQELVPEEDRRASKYSGYALVIDLEEFGSALRPAVTE